MQCTCVDVGVGFSGILLTSQDSLSFRDQSAYYLSLWFDIPCRNCDKGIIALNVVILGIIILLGYYPLRYCSIDYCPIQSVLFIPPSIAVYYLCSVSHLLRMLCYPCPGLISDFYFEEFPLTMCLQSTVIFTCSACSDSTAVHHHCHTFSPFPIMSKPPICIAGLVEKTQSWEPSL